MRKNNLVYLQDILDSIQKIEEYINKLPYQDFCKSTLVQDAVLRNFEVIGESTKRLGRGFIAKRSDIPFKPAMEMRNFLIHEYDLVNTKIVWKTIKENLPEMKEKIADLLKQKLKLF